MKTATAQILWDSTYAVNVQTCLRPESVIVKFVPTSNIQSGASLRIALPNGFNYAGHVATSIGGTAVTPTIALSGANRIVTVTLPNAVNTSQMVRVEIRQFATCQAGVSSYTTRDSLRLTGVVASSGSSFTLNRLADLFNGTSPDLSITNIVNSPSSATVAQTVTRTYRITNGGFGATKDFIVVDKFSSGQITINTSSVTANGVNVSSVSAISGDSLIISISKTTLLAMGTLISGNNDTLFSNGEAFDVQYTFVVNTCTPSSLTSQLLTNWRCPNTSRCNWFSVNTGIGTTGPTMPNIQLLARWKRRFDCLNSSSILRDTLVLRNNGGPASDILIDAGVNRGAAFDAGWGGFSPFDTGSLRIRIGRNGAWVRPNFSIVGTATGNFSGYGINCNFVGQPTVTRFTVPTLGAGDTLYVILAQKYCNYQLTTCQSSANFNSSVYPCGTGIKYSYKNFCKNATFDGGWIDAFTYRNLEAYGTNDGPVSIADGQSTDLALKFDVLTQNQDPYRFNYGFRGYTEIAVKLPSLIQFDPAVANPVYFVDQGGTTRLPYQRSGDSFKFRMINDYYYNTTLHVKVKGICDGLSCPGIIEYSIIIRQHPDTVGCSNENTQLCVKYPISWVSQCTTQCCPKGMVNLAWSIKRTNYGLADHDDNGTPSGTLNKNLLRLERMLTGDTVELVHKYYFKTNGLHPSWNFARSMFDVSTPSWFTVISDSVFVDRAANGAGLDSVYRITPTTSGKYFITDISPMAAFQNNDTVTIKLKLRLTTNLDGGGQASFNSLIAGGATNAPGWDSSFMCGPFVQKLQLLGTDGFGYIDNGIVGINGCSQRISDLAFYVRIGTGAQTYNRTWFPYEYRRVGFPTRMKFKIPKDYFVDSLELNYVTQTNIPAYPSGFTPGTNIPFTIVNDTVIFSVRNYFDDYIAGTYPLEEAFYTYYRLFLTPSCRVPNAVIQGTRLTDSFRFFTPFTFSEHNEQTGYPRINGTSYQNFHPNLVYSVPVPVSSGFSKNVSWSANVTNLSPFNAGFNWLAFRSLSNQVSIDSVKEGTTRILPDGNGFYRIGTINSGATRSFTIYGTNLSCFYDSILLYPGYSCGGRYPTSLTDTTCSIRRLPLFVQPQPASIQTQITGLGATPRDPATGTAPLYGSSTVDMCKSFPFEMEIQSSQPGNIYQVKENILLPFSSSGVGVDLLADSIYVEYPIGTTPRLGNWTGRTLMASSAPSGTMVIDLEKLDSINFNTNNGLLGTGLGTSTTRRVKIRWKMRANCNLISGSQWDAVQKARTACGSLANGDGAKTSGFKINVNGAPAPKTAAFLNTTPPLVKCGNTVTYNLQMRNMALAATNSSDSITVVLASGAQFVNGSTNFTKNPSSGSPNPRITFVNGRYILSWVASGIPSFDTTKWSFQVTSSSANTACTEQDSADLQFSTTFNPLCGLTVCNSKVLNASARIGAKVLKPNLDYVLNSGSITYIKDTVNITVPDTLKINGLQFNNTGNDSARRVFVTFWSDTDNDNVIDIGETILVRDTIQNIADSTSYTWTETKTAAHNAVPCNASLKMRVQVDCNCDSTNQVAPVNRTCVRMRTLMASLGNRVWLDTDKDGNQDNGEPGVAGVTVTLYNSAGNAIATTTTDAYGNYLFTDLPPGGYSVGFAEPTNYTFTTQNAGGSVPQENSDANATTGRTAMVTLTAGQTNLDLDCGLITRNSTNQNIGDYVWFDEDADGTQDPAEKGIAGVTVTLYDNTGKPIATTVTDKDGKYNFSDVPIGTYTVGFTPPAGMLGSPLAGSSSAGNDMNPSTFRTAPFNVQAGIDNIEIDAGFYLQPANKASLGNVVWNDLNNNGQQDAGEPGVEGVAVTLYNSSNVAVATTKTDAFGNYVFNNLDPGTYNVGFSGLPSGFTFSTPQNSGNDTTDSDINNVGTGRTGNYTLAAGDKNMTVDAGLFKSGANYTLGNYVWMDTDKDGIQDANETGLAGIMVILYNASGNPIDTTYTNKDGGYLFTNLSAGNYSVKVQNLPFGTTPTAKDASGSTDANDSDADPNGTTAQVTLGPGNPNDMTLDIGIMPAPNATQTATLGDKVWFDTDNDGIQDVGEAGIAGVKVYLYAANGTTILDSTITDGKGEYRFTGLSPGNYIVGTRLPSGYTVSPNGAGTVTTDNNGTTPVAGISKSGLVSLGAGEDNLSVDFGIYNNSTLVVGDRVWLDSDRDGQQDAGEPGISGIGVRLIDASGNVIKTVMTDENGYYMFHDVPAGSGYRVQFTNLPAGYVFTAKDTTGGGANDNTDSDVSKSNGVSDAFTVTSLFTPTNTLTSVQRSFDAGIYPSTRAAVSGTYWNDVNSDGTQGSTEPGIPGMLVTLYDNLGNVVATTITDANGNYIFPNVLPGTGYTIGFQEPPNGTIMTQQNSPGTIAGTSNSDANPTTRRTAPFNLTAGQVETNVDAGVKTELLGSIGDRVWFDNDYDGTQDASERGIPGVVLQLLDGSGNVVGTTVTDANGNYLFSGLDPGNYRVKVLSYPAGYMITRKDASGNDATDNDVDKNTKTSGIVSLAAGENNRTVDVGLSPIAFSTIGSYVFEDLNIDGVWNKSGTPLEPPAVGAKVYLWDNATNTIVDSMTTNSGGFYVFDSLPPGNYRVQVAKAGWKPTYQNVRNNTRDSMDSDIDVITGISGVYSLGTTDTNYYVWAGLIPAAVPLNANGISLTAQLLISNAKLNWVYNNEENIVRYKLYRRFGNTSNWEEIAIVNARRSMGVIEKYEFIDELRKNEFGKYYYYVIAEASNGNKVSSKVQVIHYARVADRNIYVLPNPASNYFDVVLTGVNQNNATGVVTVVSSNGRKIMSQNFLGNTVRINSTDFAEGIYFVQIQRDGVLITEKIVIQR